VSDPVRSVPEFMQRAVDVPPGRHGPLPLFSGCNWQNGQVIGEVVLKRQGNRIIHYGEVRLAKCPNGAQEQSASIPDLLSFIGSGISYLPGIFTMRLPRLKRRGRKGDGLRET